MIARSASKNVNNSISKFFFQQKEISLFRIATAINVNKNIQLVTLYGPITAIHYLEIL